MSEFSNIKGICFDLFNTLVDVGQVPPSVGAYTADILGIDRKVWRDACFGMAHQITQPTDAYLCLKELVHSIEPATPVDKIKQAARVRQQRFEHALLYVDEEVVTVLSCLHSAGFKMALVSNASSSEIQAWARSPLAKYFTSVIFSCDVGVRKPEAGIYQNALNSLGVTANECLFVGDGGSKEHHGAAALGLRPVLLTHYLDEQTASIMRLDCQSVLAAEMASLNELVTILGLV